LKALVDPVANYEFDSAVEQAMALLNKMSNV
jgi:hypothetical protein